MKRSLISPVLAALLLLAVPAAEAAQPSNAELQASPDKALEALVEGNRRFASGTTQHPRQNPEQVRAAAQGQKPFAIVVGCSDSRVPNEIVFDQGLGDLFIVRTAGQVSTYASWASVEFAHAVLGANLIVVLGHTQCGAVAAAINVPKVPGHIVTLINEIKPAVESARAMPGDLLANSVVSNVKAQVDKLRSLEPVLAPAVREGKLKIVGAVYSLETGDVRVVVP